MKEEEIESKILEKLGASKNNTPQPDPAPKKDVKSDSVISMTASEFLQVLSNLKPKEPEKTPKKEEDDDAEFYF